MSFWPKSRKARRRLTILLAIAPADRVADGSLLGGSGGRRSEVETDDQNGSRDAKSVNQPSQTSQTEPTPDLDSPIEDEDERSKSDEESDPEES